MIDARHLSHSFGTNLVLADISASLPARGVLGIVGPNGSGKTTFLRALYGSFAPDQGEVLIDDKPLPSVPRKQLAREIAVVVQERESDMSLNVWDVVMLGRLPHQGMVSRETSTDREVVGRAVMEVGVEKLVEQPFADLSGGERQRVLIARALAQQATHILLDEPTNHLDIRYQHEVLGLVKQLDASVAMVLHDLNLAAQFCDEIAVLDGGQIVAHGTPDQVLTPEVLEPVYGVRVRRHDIDGELNLVFRQKL